MARGELAKTASIAVGCFQPFQPLHVLCEVALILISMRTNDRQTCPATCERGERLGSLQFLCIANGAAIARGDDVVRRIDQSGLLLGRRPLPSKCRNYRPRALRQICRMRRVLQ
jgi:hypothetical protein